MKDKIKNILTSEYLGKKPYCAIIISIIGRISIIASIIYILVEAPICTTFYFACRNVILPTIPVIGAGLSCIVLAKIVFYLDGIYRKLYKFELKEEREKD